MGPNDQGTNRPGANDDRRGAGGRDAGPTVRGMSKHVRDHARGTLLAETSRTTLLGNASSNTGEATGADAVNFGREGFDDAPAPLKKRWLVVAAGLAVAAAGAAIIAGTGFISGDDLGLSPADSTQSREQASNDGIDGTGVDSNLTLTQTRAPCLTNLGAPADDLSPVVYEHQTQDYTIVAVTYGGSTQMCATSGRGMYSAESGSGSGSGPLTELIRQTSSEGENYIEMLGGKVTEDVTTLEIQSGGEPVAQGHLENGWFSAFATTTPGDELSYRMTMKDGTSQTVVLENPFYHDPVEQQERMEENNRAFAQGCFGDIGITLGEGPSENGEESQAPAGDYLLTSSHLQPSYLASFASNSAQVAVCTNAMSQTSWYATQPAPDKGVSITPLEMLPSPTDKGPYPVMGLAAPEVTSVDVVRADGRRRAAFLQDGFYSLMLPARNAEGLTYVVSTEDGESTTIGSE